MTNDIKVLIWFPIYASYYVEILKATEKKYGITCKDKSDFGFDVNYTNQEDFEKIIGDYRPDIVFIYNVSSLNLMIKIPEKIKVVVYCDHFYEQFSLLGRKYFEYLPKNDYLYMPILDADRLDKDKVLENKEVQKKIYFAPFVDSLGDGEISYNRLDEKKYGCEVSVIAHQKSIDYYFWCFGISSSTLQGRVLMQFLGTLLKMIRDEIIKRESADLDDEWIYNLVKNVFDNLSIRAYVRDIDGFISIWFNAIKYNILVREYGNIVVDWLIEKGYNLKLYGNGWNDEKRYKKYSMGKVDECSDELRKAYKYSKINVGINYLMGIHRRNSECIKNGCLCLQAVTKAENMVSDYRHFFKEGVDIVIYKNKQELFEKIDYYLKNNVEREQIINSGKQIISQYLNPMDVVGSVIRKIYEC